MTRSPLAYPLNRGADMDVGGAADLQTDVMRFMAILSLCLVAIFALVQSMPVAPTVGLQVSRATDVHVSAAAEGIGERRPCHVPARCSSIRSKLARICEVSARAALSYCCCSSVPSTMVL